MSFDEAEFLRKLRATFKVEAQEHLQAITTGLLQLEQLPQAQQQPVIETVFRAAHSLKGAARAVEYADIESLCQSLEETFAAWKRQEGAASPELLDTLHKRLDRVTELLGAAAAVGAAARAPAPVPELARPVAGPPTPAAGATVRIAVDVLQERLLEAEELLSVKLLARQRVEDLRELQRRVQSLGAELAGASQEQFGAIQEQVGALGRAAEQERDAVGKLVDALLANSKKLLLLPFAAVAAPLPRLVRDLCREQGKEAELLIEGEHTAVDKRILDALKDPLIHLLRNCVDHGIELPAERLRQGKPARAQIRLSVVQTAGGQVLITLADDGAGIDTAKVRVAAARHGVLPADEVALLAEAEAQALIFRSGLSTSPRVTQLSGRGLGLAIVQEQAAGLGGNVSVESRPGGGTLFRILVPGVLATFRGVLVEAAARLLVVPTNQVERVLRVRAEDIHRFDGRDTLALDGRLLPLVRLAHVLALPETGPPPIPPTGIPLIVLGQGEQRVAFAVDHVLEEQELLVKPLQRPLSRVRNVAAATVLPNGRIGFILHVADLLQSARKARGASLRAAAAPPPVPPRTILVAEDSITSRMLIKGILETAGYCVTTAIDGMDAFSRLRAGQFDLLVSDVEMPRLNGFDLTQRIRADRGLADTPVVLVTALESREHRERGAAVGANAYVVKSSFDQSTLLDVVRRLI